MSVISQIQKPKDRPPIITICGDAGTGKSSLAASFPNPVFIRVEDGVGRISKKLEKPDSFPVIRELDKEKNKTPDDLWTYLTAILREEHDYKTLVIDSVTALDSVFTQSLLYRDGRAKGLNQAFGGYGNGLDALATEHGRVRKFAGAINERRGMNVIFIAHADLETMRLPDRDDYSRYSLRLNKRAIPHYVDNVDMVAFVRLVSSLRGDDGDRKKVISYGERELVCHATAASVSKNGCGITEPIDFEEGMNPLADFLPISGLAKPRKTQPKKDRSGVNNYLAIAQDDGPSVAAAHQQLDDDMEAEDE